MRYREVLEANLNEGLQLASTIDAAAYAITLAEAYDAAPVHDKSAESSWFALKRHTIDELFPQIKTSGIEVKFTAHDPYGAYTDDALMQCRYMLWDMVVNKRLIIYTGHSDTHPVFDAETNVLFRTVHDFYTHGRMRAMFAKQVHDLGLEGKTPSPEELLELLPSIKLDRYGNVGHAFNLRGEMNAYITHVRLATKAAAPALFTEVVGQVCYKVVVGDFPTQKVTFLPDFDIFQVGKIRVGSKAAERYEEIRQAIKDGAKSVSTRIAACPKVNIMALIQEIKNR